MLFVNHYFFTLTSMDTTDDVTAIKQTLVGTYFDKSLDQMKDFEITLTWTIFILVGLSMVYSIAKHKCKKLIFEK